MIKLNNNELWQSRKKKKKKTIYLISGILVIALIGAITYLVWSQNKSVKNQAPTNSKEQIQNLQSELNSVKSKLNNLSDNAQKTQLENKLTGIENKINNLSSHDKSTIKKLEQEIKKIKQQSEGNDNPDNKEEGEFVYFDLLNGYHLFENTSLGQTNQNQIIIKISENHPRIKQLLGKLQYDKQFTIRYGKIDKEPESGLFVFNENNQELEIIEVGNPSPSPNPNPQPDPQDNIGYKYISTKINDNIYKYHITLSGTQLSFRDFIAFSKNKKTHFFSAFQGALKDANSKFSGYFWKCPPVSLKTLDKPFEFVVIKSKELADISQDFSAFIPYLTPNVKKLPAISFPNNQQPSDAILVIPALKPNVGEENGERLDYKNISQFTKNAPDEQQKAFWKEVAGSLMKELEKGDTYRWLNTHGLGVKYLHVRIDEKPKYYSDYFEYKYL